MPDFVSNMPNSANKNLTTCMVSLKSSSHIDANSEPNSYRTTNFSTSIFHSKFDLEFRDFSDKKVKYILVLIDSSMSKLFKYDFKMFVYDELDWRIKFSNASSIISIEKPLSLGPLFSPECGLHDFNFIYGLSFRGG